MFRVLSLNGESRNVRLASDPDGVPVVVDDYGCSWHVSEFDVEAPPVVEAASTVVEVAEPAKASVKRERKPKPVADEPAVTTEPTVAVEPVADPVPVEPVVE